MRIHINTEHSRGTFFFKECPRHQSNSINCQDKRRLHVRRAISQVPQRESLIFLPTPLHHPLLKEGESPHQIVLPADKLSLISSFATTLITHFTPIPASSRWRQRQVSLEMLYSLEGVASLNPAVLILSLLCLLLFL